MEMPAVIESIEDMAKRGDPSPDDADAYALTFAQPVAPIAVELEEPEGCDFGSFSSGGRMG